MVVEVFGTLTTQVSIKVEVDQEDAVHTVEKSINSYNTEVGIITLFDDRGIGRSIKVHDIDIKWESVLSKESA